MGTKKKLVLPEEIPVLETNHDFDVTIEIVESDYYEARLDEFVKLVAEAVSKWVPRAEKYLKDQGKDTFFSEYLKIRQERAKLASCCFSSIKQEWSRKPWKSMSEPLAGFPN